MRLKCLLSAYVVSLGLTANAIEISNLSAGRLHAAGIPASETAVTISGQMNAADFAYIFDNLNALQELILTNVEIVAYSGTPLPYTGLKASPAGKLPDYALTGLYNLKSLSLPTSLKEIGNGALSGSGITELTIPVGVTAIGDYAAMRCEMLTDVTIPSSVNTIGTRAFAYCPKLKNVNISARITEISEGLFEACGGLHTLSLQNLTACSNIGPWAVAECNGLSTLILPDSSEALEKGSLYGAAVIETLRLPEELSYIGDNAMGAMSSLNNIDVSKIGDIPQLGDNVWSSVDQSNITLITPNDMTSAYKEANQWNKFKIVSLKEWENSTETIASTINGAELLIKVTDGKIIVSAKLTLGRISVFDVSGKRIVSVVANHDAEISTAGWPSGVYLVATELGAAKIRI